MKKRIFVAFALMVLCGCWTISETPYPKVIMSKVPDGKDIAVQLAGFEASITTYVPIYGYETIVTPHYGYRHYGHLHSTVVATETYIPKITKSPVFMDRATDNFEKAGFLLKTTKPKYRVEVNFSGPFIGENDKLIEAGWILLSALTAEKGKQSWSAQLKIYDHESGKLLFSNDYEQTYEVLVWGPVPLFSIGCNHKTEYNALQSWCLTALTDRVVSEATAFLVNVK